jgi:hypothetical protein
MRAVRQQACQTWRQRFAPAGPATTSPLLVAALKHVNRAHDGGLPLDYYISYLSETVHNDHRPTGKGAQLLTRVIEHASNTSKTDLRPSQVSRYAHRHGVLVPQAYLFSSDKAAKDNVALDRHRGQDSEILS